MPVPAGLYADSLARVRVHDLPEGGGAGGRGNFPQQIVTGGCPQFAIASGLHVQAGRHATCLPPCRRQLKLRGPYGGEVDAPQLMPVVMGPQRGGRRELAGIVGKSHPDGRRIACHGIHAAGQMIQHGTGMIRERPRRNAGRVRQKSEARPLPRKQQTAQQIAGLRRAQQAKEQRIHGRFQSSRLFQFRTGKCGKSS